MKTRTPLKTALACLAACLLLASVSSVSADTHRDGLTPDEQNNIDVFEKTNKSVVYVINSQIQRDFFSLNIYEIPAGAGTGFVWDRRGLIVTNYHVIQNANKIKITLWDRSTWDGEVVGTAPHKDLAVIRINAPAAVLFPITAGDSDALDVGRKVLAIGNPFGLDTTLTVGVVSALGREIEAEGRRIKDLIQTDAAINPGNSGGPLLNSRGELVGVNTIIISGGGHGSVGVGFAIPVNTVKSIIPQLIEHGRIMRPIIGITTVHDSIARRVGVQGVIIYQVPAGSNAEKAGMIGVQQDRNGNIIWGDIITKVDQLPIRNQNDLYSALEEYKPGDVVTIEANRNNRRMTFKIRLSAPE